MNDARVRWLAVAVGVAASLLAGGCSLAFGIDRDEYTRGSSVTTLDAGGDQAVSVVESGAESASPESPCTAAHRLCDDFDAPTTLTERGWSAPFITNGSTLGVDGVDFVSRPNSLSVVGTPDGTASMDRAIPGLVPQGDLALALDLRLGDPGPGVALAEVIVGTYQVRLLTLGDRSITFDEWDEKIGRLSARRSSTTVLNTAWNHVELVLRFVPNRQAGSRIVLRVNGSVAVDDGAAPSVDTGAVSVDLGEIDHPNATVRARFDNVTFDAP